eukprot:snap_masked-scaffold_24-processed-gene-5.36-mRNA-1 protein AED:0.87 eAED:1.00 QI:0/-1/0/1/-1/1/1/0/102
MNKELIEAEQFRRNVTEIMQKVNELQIESNEHESVLQTLSNLPSNKTCHRLISSVLIEQPLKETIPSLKKNKENLDNLIKTLIQQAKEFEQKADKILSSVNS